VWVNRGETDWKVAGAVLPEYGFLGRVATEEGVVEASVARREGVIVEMVRAPRQIYVNGRQVIDSALPIRPTVRAVNYQGDRRFELLLHWQADVPIPDGYRPFLHFCDAQGEILFQAVQDPRALDTQRKGTIGGRAMAQIPDELAPGATSELRIGLYRPSGGARLEIVGPRDGDRRIRMGTVRLEGDGDKLTGLAWTPHEPEPDPMLARQNPQNKPIDFGPVTTVGACRLTCGDDALVVTPLPGRGVGKFTVRLAWEQLPWKLPEPTHVERLAEDGRTVSRDPVRPDDRAILIECEPGVFAYRLEFPRSP